ncbi:Na+/H+ antiporter subunit E [Halothermothrix orenii]|uniref:Cation antiporter n=1 Tax=Halothermothrix orenii (strain H 168 / OCM 544 / DSM 9562) TaxID=373903 RepID=B8CXE3_HALOH|nr:Na+/H+ antiporter subunit E [Halothermothrix orenii]ACL69962.1 cation antiporter [Halothermothrix orenii H 168]
MKKNKKGRVFTFIFVFLVWMLLTASPGKDTLLLGIIVSLVSSFLFSDMLFRFSSRTYSFKVYVRKILLMILFIFVFFYEAFVAAIKVARHAFEKTPSFSPGIVKVKTSLTNVSAITILANLITLTPGTLTLDFDTSERSFYIHWIDVHTEEEAETRKALIERFERWLGVIFR